MSHRRIAAVVTAFAVLLTGCGSGKDEAATSSNPAQNKLDAGACTDLTAANLDLATATSNADAQKAADVFGKYNPPAEVSGAVDKIVKAGGVKFDGSDFELYNDHIDAWVRDVCPE
jgi:guanyl-specific ribonuclease Sa